MSAIGPEMHQGIASAPQTVAEVSCDGCGQPFAPKRRWQRFCKPGCRSTYHSSLTPEALRREIDELKREAATLRQEFEVEKARVAELERRLTVLDEPVA